MNTIIRKAKLNDINKIMEIITEAKAFIASYGSPQWQNSYNDPGVFIDDIKQGKQYVLCVDDSVEGVFLLDTYEKTYDIVYGGAFTKTTYYVIHRLAFSNAIRGKGYVRYVFDYVKKLVEEENIESIRIDTHKLNIPMQRALEKHGFIYVGIIHLLGNQIDNERLAYEYVKVE